MILSEILYLGNGFAIDVVKCPLTVLHVTVVFILDSERAGSRERILAAPLVKHSEVVERASVYVGRTNVSVHERPLCSGSVRFGSEEGLLRIVVADPEVPAPQDGTGFITDSHECVAFAFRDFSIGSLCLRIEIE